MSWLTNFVRPKLRALIKKSDSPNNPYGTGLKIIAPE